MGRGDLGKELFNFLQIKICSGLPWWFQGLRLCFQGWELEYDQAGQGTKISCASQRGQKKKKNYVQRLQHIRGKLKSSRGR